MFKTTLLDEFRKAERERAEDLRNEMIVKVRSAVLGLSKKIPFEEAHVFGSLLKPSFTEESDIDIAFLGLRDEDFFKAMAFLSSTLEKDVDVVQLEDHRLRKKIIKEGIKVL